MILDKLLAFDPTANPKDLTGVAGTYASTNVLDWGNLGLPSTSSTILGVGQVRDMGIGDDPALKLMVQVNIAFAGGTSVQVAVQGAIDDGTGNPSTFNTWYSSPAFATAGLNVGSRLLQMDFPRPPDGIAIPRFVRLAYVTLGTFTAGKLVSYLVLDRDDQPYQSTDNSILGGYPAGINIAN